jgi:hypothetical protein
LLLRQLETSQQKCAIYEMLIQHLGLLIDEALRYKFLPPGVTKEVALEVQEELTSRLLELRDMVDRIRRGENVHAKAEKSAKTVRKGGKLVRIPPKGE